ncbi:hypothetical protein OG760_21010 [Streptomyces sp. NBC_00963]|uniref:hypothetical protein n=1 Tax=Streptomyces sp. NBC_00963 TaxID=2903697 RepID=UPI003867E84E|nr:hypothetical protein OG760_21010 [Streptomyces sp. NBC_00963]
MTTWQPEPGETLIARAAVSFATGLATEVSRMRWFRDSERNDIQHELPGWPEGPTFTRRTKAASRGRKAGKFGGGLLLVLTLGVIESLAGSGSTGTASKKGSPQEPENEVEDFPVIWGEPGTLARTLPWQLDPSRRPRTDRTHAVVTDRRLLIIGLLDDEDDPHDEVLWETDRANIATAERMKFCEYEKDVKVVFTDGSWCRLAGWNANCAHDFSRAAANPLKLIPLQDLSPGQQETLAAFVKGKTSHGDPWVVRRPSGNYLIELLQSDQIYPEFGIATHFRFMGPTGEDVTYQPGDL